MHQLNTQGSEPGTGITPYQFDGRNVRMIEMDGETWFVATDVARELGYAEAKDLTRTLDDDEKGRHSMPTLGGDQELTVISEPGLYRAITQRRANKKHDDKLLARIARFQRWVFHDVLPSIRKHGQYGAPDPLAVLNDATSLRTLLLASAERELALKSQLDDMQPKIEAHDRIAESHGTFCRSTAAKMLGVPPLTLIRWLRTNGWTFRRPGDKDDLAYQSKIAAGLLEHKITTGQKPDGTEWSSTQVRVTPKGLTVLAKAFPPPVQEA